MTQTIDVLMIPFFRPLLLIILMGFSFNHISAQNIQKDNTQKDFLEVSDEREDGLGLGVRYYSHYASNEPNGFVIGIMLWSTSDKNKYRYAYSGKVFDPEVSIRLIAPSGQVLVAYKDMPGAKFPEIRPEKMHVDVLTGRGYTSSFSLSEQYPITETGEYRCTLSKRVFREETNSTPKPGALGTPVDLETPEFKFHIDSIDPKYRSGWADLVPSLRIQDPAASTGSAPLDEESVAGTPTRNEGAKPHGIKEEKPASSTSWLLWIIGLMVCMVGLSRFFKKTRNK